MEHWCRCLYHDMEISVKTCEMCRTWIIYLQCFLTKFLLSGYPSGWFAYVTINPHVKYNTSNKCIFPFSFGICLWVSLALSESILLCCLCRCTNLYTYKGLPLNRTSCRKPFFYNIFRNSVMYIFCIPLCCLVRYVVVPVGTRSEDRKPVQNKCYLFSSSSIHAEIPRERVSTTRWKSTSHGKYEPCTRYTQGACLRGDRGIPVNTACSAKGAA